MCYSFNCRLVLDLYILFQTFLAVFITQKLGSNFKYQRSLHRGMREHNNFEQVFNS